MASFWWGKNRKEEEVVKPEVKLEEPKVKTEVKPSFYEVVSNYLYNRVGYNWGTVYSVTRNGNGVHVTININPTYLFPQPLRTEVGTLVIGDYRCKVNHISLSFSIEDSDYSRYNRNYRDYSSYDNYDYDRYDRYRGYESTGLSIGRQVFLNSDYDFVSQNNELILSEQFVRINIPSRINVSVSDIRELDRRILSVIEDSKKFILENFQEEIIKSKSEIVQKEFKKNITTQLVTDTFQHVIDLVPDSEVGEYKDAVSAVLFVPIKISSEKDRMSLDLDKKTIDIFYELMEGASRIKGEYDVLTTLNFIGGIQLVISPKPIDLESVKIDGEKERERKQYEQMMRNSLLNREMVIRNPYTALDNLGFWE
jgi:hypothetical protein